MHSSSLSSALVTAILVASMAAPRATSAPSTAPATAASPAKATRSGAPITRKMRAKDTYHGVSVEDPYRWLERGDAPEVKAFIAAQNAHARAALDELPGRDAIEARTREILGASSVAYTNLVEVKGQLFAAKTQPPKQQPFVVVMPDANSPEQERVVVDPNALDPSGTLTIDWFRVSPDGRLMICSMSKGGSGAGDAHVFDVATGKELEAVAGVNGGTAGGGAAWLPDSSGFFYTRYPRGSERPAADKLFFVQLYLHKLGAPTEKDTYQIGRDFPRIAEIFLDAGPGGALLVTVQKGDGGEFMFHLKAADGSWRQLADYQDRAVQMFFGERDDLYVLSRKDAPRGKLLRAPIAGFDLAKAAVVLPEGNDALVSDIWADNVVTINAGAVYTQFQLGGPSELRVTDLDGKPKPGPKLLPVSGVGGAVPLASGDVLFANVSFVEPKGWYRFNPKTGVTTRQKISTTSPVKLSGVTVLREMAMSKDGTAVPMNILLPKGKASGASLPFVVTGYGGYNVNIEPSFQALRSLFLDRGVGVAVVNLRGGGEFGEAWHRAGSLEHKQHVFDDFIAAVEHLIARKHAAAGKVAITGRSNGGLLMGAVVTQRPELFAAVTSLVGYYDMLRIELEPNGAFNTTEYGTVKDPAQFRALHAYSPYHRVQDGTAYPPALLMVGANDVTVAPWHSRKMIARLQAASSSTAPLLLVTTFDAGHGAGNSIDQEVASQTDAASFMLHALGVPLAQ